MLSGDAVTAGGLGLCRAPMCSDGGSPSPFSRVILPSHFPAIN